MDIMGTSVATESDHPDTNNFIHTLEASAIQYNTRLRNCRLARDITTGRLSHRGASEYLQQFGVAVIQAIGDKWFESLLSRPDLTKWEQVFFLACRQREAVHWKMWQRMATAFGLSESDFLGVRLLPVCAELHAFVSIQCKENSLPVAVVLTSLVIEQGSHEVTSLIAPSLSTMLKDAERDWILAHARANRKHFRRVRDILANRIASDSNPTATFTAITATFHQGFDLFVQAIEESYDPQSG